jgi:hypothetical protein
MKNEYALILDQLTSMRKLRKKILDDINANLKEMNSRDFIVLHNICKSIKEPTMSDLSESSGLSNALITSSIDSLEGLKLVKRKRGPDRRSYVLKLTADGIAKCKEMEKLKYSSINSIFSSMTGEDIATLKEILKKLNELMEKYT